ncbi:MAG: hypothetical protein E6Q32_06940 [Neisseriales bacterium]|nr:MAG: hypothetical protein E6Q32_06940 [Neisseriales bacterium]
MENKQKEIDLSKVILILKENRKQIGIVTAVTTLLAIIYCIFATPIFTAKTVINPPKLTDAGSGVSQALGGLAILAGGGGGFLSQKTDTDVAIALLNTNALKDMVINKLDLGKYYGVKDSELARRSLSGHVKFFPDMKSGFLEIDVDDKDPKLATKIANYYCIALGQLISNIAYGRSSQKMQFLEQQESAAKASLKIAQNALKTFALKNGISAGVQAQVITSLSTQLQAQLVVAQSQLQAMSLYATSDNPDYKSLQAKVDGLRQQLDAISGQGDTSDQFSIPASLAPELSQQYANLMRDLVMNEEMLKVITKQYQASRLDVLSEIAPTGVQVIDIAQIPIYKTRPKRLNILLGWFLFGLIGGCVYFIIRNGKEIIIYREI